MRVIKPNPHDPDWKFPYATRAHIDKLRAYFTSFPKAKGWHVNKNTRALPQKEARQMLKETNWPSVPPQHRPKVEEWFQMKCKQIKHERGVLTPGKMRSLRMQAAYYGRHVLTGRRAMDRALYEQKKKIWLAYLAWEHQQLVDATPKPEGKTLDIG